MIISTIRQKEYLIRIFFLKILPYYNYLVYFCSKNNHNMESNKIIHVHLIFEKKDFYFGSISAIFEVLDANTVGMKKNTLLHAGLAEGSPVCTRRALIRQSHIIRSRSKSRK